MQNNLFKLLEVCWADIKLGESGPQDGLSDHTGIVEKVENGTVYTIEGNSDNQCVLRNYPFGDYEILGYGILNP